MESWKLDNPKKVRQEAVVLSRELQELYESQEKLALCSERLTEYRRQVERFPKKIEIKRQWPVGILEKYFLISNSEMERKHHLSWWTRFRLRYHRLPATEEAPDELQYLLITSRIKELEQQCMKYREFVKDADTKKEMSEQCSDVIMSEDSDEDEKSDDDEKDEDEDKEDEPKKFSFDAYADNGALMALLEAETEENRDFAIGLFSEGNTAVFSKLMALKKENDTYKKNAEIEEKKNCDKTFAECMSEVKGEIDNETYDKLFAEGEAIQKMSDMTIFTQKVKAFAYDAKKVVGKDDGVFVVGAPVVTTDTKIDDTDVFARLASKYQ